MKYIVKLSIAAAVFTAFAATASATPEANSPKPAHEGPSVSIPASKIVFTASGLKTSAGEVFVGQGYGNFSASRHGTFMKLPPGFVTPNHTHTEDYYAVVVKGVVVNAQTGSKEIRLPVGSYWFQRGEEDHVTKCVSKTECLIFNVQLDKFDFIPSKQD